MVQSIIFFFCQLGRLLRVGTSQAAQTEQNSVTPTSQISFLPFKAACLHGQRCKKGYCTNPRRVEGKAGSRVYRSQAPLLVAAKAMAVAPSWGCGQEREPGGAGSGGAWCWSSTPAFARTPCAQHPAAAGRYALAPPFGEKRWGKHNV